MALDADERRKIARVIWAYTGKTQPDLEAELGWSKDRLRSMISSAKHSPPSTDELLELAERAGVPAAVVIDGWQAADSVAQLQDDVSGLRVGLERLAGVVAQQAEVLRALRDQGRGTGSTEGSPQ